MLRIQRSYYYAADPRFRENQIQRRLHRVSALYQIEMAAEQALLDEHALARGVSSLDNGLFFALGQIISDHHRITALHRPQAAGNGLAGHSYRAD